MVPDFIQFQQIAKDLVDNANSEVIPIPFYFQSKNIEYNCRSCVHKKLYQQTKPSQAYQKCFNTPANNFYQYNCCLQMCHKICIDRIIIKLWVIFNPKLHRGHIRLHY